jgi:hypothetical protein
MSTIETQVVKASDLRSAVIDRIIEVRYADQFARYEKELAAYERALKKGKKQFVKTETNYIGETTQQQGYQVLRRRPNGVMESDWIPRPTKPTYGVFTWFPYDRSFGFTTHAKQVGVLAHPEVNREVNIKRVERYTELMQKGEWCDLLSDPISVTKEGHVINGQHRLAAAADTDWSKVENDPLFLVVFGVDPEEAILADMSKRTARDQSTIAVKVLAAR